LQNLIEDDYAKKCINFQSTTGPKNSNRSMIHRLQAANITYGKSTRLILPGRKMCGSMTVKPVAESLIFWPEVQGRELRGSALRNFEQSAGLPDPVVTFDAVFERQPF
jgi:hypothetical protein